MQIPQVGPPLACPLFGHADGYRHGTGKTRHEPRYTPAASVTLEEIRCKLLLSSEKTPLSGLENASATLRSAEELWEDEREHAEPHAAPRTEGVHEPARPRGLAGRRLRRSPRRAARPAHERAGGPGPAAALPSAGLAIP